MVQANSKEFPYENYYFDWQESWEESQVKETAFHSKDWAQQILEGDRKNQPIVAATSSKERQFDLAAQFLPFSHLRMIAPIFRYLMFQTMNGSRFLFQSVADGVRELPWFLHLTSLHMILFSSSVVVHSISSSYLRSSSFISRDSFSRQTDDSPISL